MTTTIPGGFLAQAAVMPDAPAIVDGAVRLTYEELERRSAAVAAELSRAAPPGSLVGVELERSAEAAVALLGVLRAGCAYVPLDPLQPTARLARIRAVAQPAAVIGPDGEVERLGGPPANGSRPPAPGDLAYVLFTSGSSGEPKGVAVEHRAVVNLARDFGGRFSLGAGDRVLHWASLGFDVSVWELFVPLLAGAAVCVARQEQILHPPTLAELIRDEGVTVVDLPPFLLDALNPGECDTVRIAMTGMEAVPRRVVQRWSAGNRPVYNGYGPTEACVIATVMLCDPTDPDDPPIGHPIAGMTAIIVDQHDSEASEGELLLGGAGLARGYLADEALTRERFPELPVHGRMYRTGDLVRRRRDGALLFLGRTDDQVQIRGHRVEPVEVSARLLEHPGIAECHVAAEEDRDGTVLAAYWSAASAAPAEQELRRFLAARVPAYMVPRRIVRVDALPRTHAGKVDGGALAAAAKIRGAERRDPSDLLLRLVARSLGRGDISPDDNFIELGGDSLRAMDICARLREAYPDSALRADQLLHARDLREVDTLARGAAER